MISSSSVLDKDTVLQHHFVWLNSHKLYLQYLYVCYFYLGHQDITVNNGLQRSQNSFKPGILTDFNINHY